MRLAESLTGWYVGLGIGVFVIVVVVAIVASILTLAARIGLQAQAIVDSLEDSEANTASLWDVQKINGAGVAILKAAQTGRAVLGG